MKKIYLLFAAFLPLAALAQCFSTGTGADGAYHATTNTTLAGGTYNYSSFTIDPGVTVTVTGAQPLIVFSTGNVTISGTLTATGGAGGSGVTYTSGGIAGTGVAGGADGAPGVYSSSEGPLAGNMGNNTGGGGAGGNWSGGGGAGYSAVGDSASMTDGLGGSIYGDENLTALLGGSGGGSGSGGYGCGSGGGGAGGGIIAFYADIIDITAGGLIVSNGGAGGSDGTGNCGGGGGGSGGAIVIAANLSCNNSGAVSAIGGMGGASAVSGSPYYGAGANGADGRIRIDSPSMTGSGTVTPAPFQLFTLTSQDVVATCEGTDNGQATIDVEGGTMPYTFMWTESGETTASATELPAGVNTFTVVDVNGCSATTTVTIGEVPAAQPSTQTLAICSGESVTVGSSTYTTSGTYQDILTSVNGCDSTVTTNLTVNGPYTSSQSFDLCSGESVTVGMNTYAASGVYQDVFTSATGCDSTVTTTLTIASPVNVSVTNNVISLTAQATGSTFQWIDCDNNNTPISGETSATFSPAANGSYAVIVTTNNCSDTSACEAITDLGVTEAALNLVTVYPNPTSGNVTLDFGKETAIAQLTVTDLSGRVVTAQQALTAKTLSIDLSGESKGVYFLNVQADGTQRTLKITKH